MTYTSLALPTSIDDLGVVLATLKQQRMHLDERRTRVAQSIVEPPTTKARDEFARLFADNRIPTPRHNSSISSR
ncbi:hypothetical protein SDRG_04642 [Saprolegnia diclina VS20]|uniref:Uncharacterized protein n=1 Tax=Saprolegnia diclina (strain VS20) TaxID=1156394 RepID=T0QVZ4_SAPDV|nr:hypothetical protein SDRG_04642 [Saprolegnia diclina VS20]EQC38215.1 hypothetical protein SDRG_04642 [Saprolegnia diclina VS20]|eukprot:XP_008608542.1 hypothetical protein SDRG_04642 [Saprolegnia diclina VS20]